MTRCHTRMWFRKILTLVLLLRSLECSWSSTLRSFFCAEAESKANSFSWKRLAWKSWQPCGTCVELSREITVHVYSLGHLWSA